MGDELRLSSSQSGFTGGVSPSSIQSQKATVALKREDQTVETHSISKENKFSILKGVQTLRNLWESLKEIIISPFSGKRKIFEGKAEEWKKEAAPSGSFKKVVLETDTVGKKNLFLQTGYLKQAFGEQGARLITDLVQTKFAKFVMEAKLKSLVAEGKVGKELIPKTFYEAIIDGKRVIIKIKYDNKTGEIIVSASFTAGGEKTVKKLVRFGVPERLSRDNSIFVYKRPLIGPHSEERVAEQGTELREKVSPRDVSSEHQLSKTVGEERLREEFSIWKALTEGEAPVQNLVSMHSVTRADATQKGFLEPFYFGGPVTARIQEAHTTSKEKAQRLKWAQDGARALAGMHDKGYVHSDVKSDNFMIDDAGHLRLGDFGTTIRPGSKEKYKGSSLEYDPPEVWRSGKGKGEKTADVFAFGLFLTEVFYGSKANPLHAKPREDMTQERKQEADIEDRAFKFNAPFGKRSIGLHDQKYNELIEGLSDKWGDPRATLILQCLAQDPRNRPSMSEVYTRLMNMTSQSS